MKRLLLLWAISFMLISGIVSAACYTYQCDVPVSYSYQRGWSASSRVTGNSRTFVSTVGPSQNYYRRSFQPSVGSPGYPYRNSFVSTVGSPSDPYRRSFVSTVGSTPNPNKRTFSSRIVTTNYPYGNRFQPVVSTVRVAPSGSRQDPLIRMSWAQNQPSRDQRYYANYYS